MTTTLNNNDLLKFNSLIDTFKLNLTYLLHLHTPSNISITSARSLDKKFPYGLYIPEISNNQSQNNQIFRASTSNDNKIKDFPLLEYILYSLNKQHILNNIYFHREGKFCFNENINIKKLNKILKKKNINTVSNTYLENFNDCWFGNDTEIEYNTNTLIKKLISNENFKSTISSLNQTKMLYSEEFIDYITQIININYINSLKAIINKCNDNNISNIFNIYFIENIEKLKNKLISIEEFNNGVLDIIKRNNLYNTKIMDALVSYNENYQEVSDKLKALYETLTNMILKNTKINKLLNKILTENTTELFDVLLSNIKEILSLMLKDVEVDRNDQNYFTSILGVIYLLHDQTKFTTTLQEPLQTVFKKLIKLVNTLHDTTEDNFTESQIIKYSYYLIIILATLIGLFKINIKYNDNTEDDLEYLYFNPEIFKISKTNLKNKDIDFFAQNTEIGTGKGIDIKNINGKTISLANLEEISVLQWSLQPILTITDNIYLIIVIYALGYIIKKDNNFDEDNLETKDENDTSLISATYKPNEANSEDLYDYFLKKNKLNFTTIKTYINEYMKKLKYKQDSNGNKECCDVFYYVQYVTNSFRRLCMKYLNKLSESNDYNTTIDTLFTKMTYLNNCINYLNNILVYSTAFNSTKLSEILDINEEDKEFINSLIDNMETIQLTNDKKKYYIKLYPFVVSLIKEIIQLMDVTDTSLTEEVGMLLLLNSNFDVILSKNLYNLTSSTSDNTVIFKFYDDDGNYINPIYKYQDYMTQEIIYGYLDTKELYKRIFFEDTSSIKNIYNNYLIKEIFKNIDTLVSYFKNLDKITSTDLAADFITKEINTTISPYLCCQKLYKKYIEDPYEFKTTYLSSVLEFKKNTISLIQDSGVPFASDSDLSSAITLLSNNITANTTLEIKDFKTLFDSNDIEFDDNYEKICSLYAYNNNNISFTSKDGIFSNPEEDILDRVAEFVAKYQNIPSFSKYTSKILIENPSISTKLKEMNPDYMNCQRVLLPLTGDYKLSKIFNLDDLKLNIEKRYIQDDNSNPDNNELIAFKITNLFNHITVPLFINTKKIIETNYNSNYVLIDDNKTYSFDEFSAKKIHLNYDYYWIFFEENTRYNIKIYQNGKLLKNTDSNITCDGDYTTKHVVNITLPTFKQFVKNYIVIGYVELDSNGAEIKNSSGNEINVKHINIAVDDNKSNYYFLDYKIELINNDIVVCDLLYTTNGLTITNRLNDFICMPKNKSIVLSNSMTTADIKDAELETILIDDKTYRSINFDDRLLMKSNRYVLPKSCLSAKATSSLTTLTSVKTITNKTYSNYQIPKDKIFNMYVIGRNNIYDNINVSNKNTYIKFTDNIKADEYFEMAMYLLKIVHVNKPTETTGSVISDNIYTTLINQYYNKTTFKELASDSLNNTNFILPTDTIKQYRIVNTYSYTDTNIVYKYHIINVIYSNELGILIQIDTNTKLIVTTTNGFISSCIVYYKDDSTEYHLDLWTLEIKTNKTNTINLEANDTDVSNKNVFIALLNDMLQTNLTIKDVISRQYPDKEITFIKQTDQSHDILNYYKPLMIKEKSIFETNGINWDYLYALKNTMPSETDTNDFDFYNNYKEDYPLLLTKEKYINYSEVNQFNSIIKNDIDYNNNINTTIDDLQKLKCQILTNLYRNDFIFSNNIHNSDFNNIDGINKNTEFLNSSVVKELLKTSKNIKSNILVLNDENSNNLDNFKITEIIAEPYTLDGLEYISNTNFSISWLIYAKCEYTTNTNSEKTKESYLLLDNMFYYLHLMCLLQEYNSSYPSPNYNVTLDEPNDLLYFRKTNQFDRPVNGTMNISSYTYLRDLYKS